jgi:hypothetical protein
VHDVTLGLDFGPDPARARLAEGRYLAVQVPESERTGWDWGRWAFEPASRRVVDRSGEVPDVPFNYLIFRVSRHIPVEDARMVGGGGP